MTAPKESVQHLLSRVCGYMGISGETIRVCLYHEDRPPVETDGLIDGTAGLYTEEHGAFRIWLEDKNLDDPLALVATMAHELGHVFFSDKVVISADEEDHRTLDRFAGRYFSALVSSLPTRSFMKARGELAVGASLRP